MIEQFYLPGIIASGQIGRMHNGDEVKLRKAPGLEPKDQMV